MAKSVEELEALIKRLHEMAVGGYDYDMIYWEIEKVFPELKIVPVNPHPGMVIRDVRLPVKLVEQLEEMAWHLKITFNELVTQLLEEGLARMEAQEQAACLGDGI